MTAGQRPPGLRHRLCCLRHWCPRIVSKQKPRPTVLTAAVVQEKNAIKGRGPGRGKARSEQPPSAIHGSRSKPATRPEACGGAAAPRRRRRNARPAPRASTTASWSRKGQINALDCGYQASQAVKESPRCCRAPTIDVPHKGLVMNAYLLAGGRGIQVIPLPLRVGSDSIWRPA